jgi:hypothetical protein
MGLWAPLAQLGHGAIRLLVGRLLTLDKAREGAPGLLVVLVYWKPSPSRPWGSRWASSDPCLRFHSLTELLSLFCLNDSCAGSAPRPVPPIAHDSTTTAARNGANDSHNLVSPRQLFYESVALPTGRHLHAREGVPQFLSSRWT